MRKQWVDLEPMRVQMGVVGRRSEVMDFIVRFFLIFLFNIRLKNFDVY